MASRKSRALFRSCGAGPRSIPPLTRYEAYDTTAAGTNPDGLGFTGHVNDPSTGLVYMQQRYYDPLAARFLSVDPIVTDASTGESFNRYEYVHSNPYRYTDPSGSYFEDHGWRDNDLDKFPQPVLLDGQHEGGAGDKKSAPSDGFGPWSGWGDFWGSIQSIWTDPWPGAGGLEGQLAAIAPIGAVGAEGAGAVEGLPSIVKAVNSNLAHAVERAVERAVFETSEAAAAGLRALTQQLNNSGFPPNAVLDTANLDRVLVPIGNAGMAVYQVAKNGTAKLKTVLNELVDP